jgi:hypothetical protein
MPDDRTVIATAIPYEQMGVLRSLWYQKRPKQLTLDDFTTSLNRMLFCLGAPGSGKSRLIAALAFAYITAGFTVMLIDTGLDVFRQVLAFCIRKRIPPDRVVIMDAPSGVPVPDVCPLAVPSDLPRATIVDGFLATWRGWLAEGLGPRQEDIMRMLAISLIACNAPYLPWAVRFLTEEKVRDQMLRRANDPELARYWGHMTKKNSSFHIWIESSRNKLNSAAQNPLVSSYFDSNIPTFDFYTGFNTGKIVLLNASDNFYQDQSSQSLLCSTMLFLAHQALLRRESMPMALRRPVAILCDEVSRYWVSSFLIPHVVLGRKYGGEMKLFCQSAQQVPPADLDILLSSCGHLVSFTIGARDAQRIAPDLFLPKDAHLIKGETGRDIYGAYGDTAYWSITEQAQHGVAELMNQGRQEMIWRIKTTTGAAIYLAKTAHVPDFHVTKEEEETYRLESARHHAPMAASVP